MEILRPLSMEESWAEQDEDAEDVMLVQEVTSGSG